MTPIHEQIRNARKAKGLTQHQVEAKTGITQAYISRIEKGMCIPKVPVLIQFCELYDCQIIISK